MIFQSIFKVYQKNLFNRYLLRKNFLIDILLSLNANLWFLGTLCTQAQTKKNVPKLYFHATSDLLKVILIQNVQ